MYKKINEKLIHVANGRQKADLVLKNANIINVFTESIEVGDVAVVDGMIAGIGTYEGVVEKDMTGKYLCPGFIDGHIHLESSMVAPTEFEKAVLPHGTTAVVTDPHEIANVAGCEGIEFMLKYTAIDTYVLGFNNTYLKNNNISKALSAHINTAFFVYIRQT